MSEPFIAEVEIISFNVGGSQLHSNMQHSPDTRFYPASIVPRIPARKRS
jgi:hypothetical protein